MIFFSHFTQVWFTRYISKDKKKIKKYKNSKWIYLYNNFFIYSWFFFVFAKTVSKISSKIVWDRKEEKHKFLLSYSHENISSFKWIVIINRRESFFVLFIYLIVLLSHFIIFIFFSAYKLNPI